MQQTALLASYIYFKYIKLKRRKNYLQVSSDAKGITLGGQPNMIPSTPAKTESGNSAKQENQHTDNNKNQGDLPNQSAIKECKLTD